MITNNLITSSDFLTITDAALANRAVSHFLNPNTTLDYTGLKKKFGSIGMEVYIFFGNNTA